MIFGSLFDTLLIEKINSSLVQIMDFRLLGVKPFPGPVLTYYPLCPQEQTSVKFQSLFSMSCPLCGTVNVKTTHGKNQVFAFLFQKYLFIEKNNHIIEIEWETSASLGLAPIMKCTSAVDANPPCIYRTNLKVRYSDFILSVTGQNCVRCVSLSIFAGSILW